MEIKNYNVGHKTEWDDFVRRSKNGTFLFCRDFMEYHADRFKDHSLMFYHDDELIAIMPAHIHDQVFYTHQGLTYGGLVMSSQTTATDALAIFEHLTITLTNQGFKKIVYKTIPHIYHSLPSEEDLYALFRYKAVLTERNISSAVLLDHKLPYSDSRIRGLKKANKNGLYVKSSGDVDSFWAILYHNLMDRYNTHPVHTAEELKYLKSKFPSEIHLFAVFDSQHQMQGGCLIFEMKSLIHAQYTAATRAGKDSGAIDLVIDYLIQKAAKDKIYFDYGTSTQHNGAYLSEKLIYQKEGFGARAIVYDVYTISL